MTWVTVERDGSLRDGDTGAYHTGINLTELAGAEATRFLVWRESQSEALVIGPGWRWERSRAGR